MKLSDIIFVPSVQHTGTWFTIKFLQNFIPAVKELTFLLEPDGMKPEDANVLYRPTYSQPLSGPTVTHIHLPIVRNVGGSIDFFGTWFEQTWLMNLATKRSLPIQTLLTLCNFFKTVIPVRDPVAAILTRESRHPQFRHFFIVDGFVALATEFARHPNVKFLPIDMTDDPDERKKLLLSVIEHCGIERVGSDELIQQWATEWKPENYTPGNDLRILYESGDIAGLRARLGPKWAEIEYLKNMASIILPFMAGLGYTRERLIKL